MGLGSLLAFAKGDVVYWFNRHQNEFFNIFFKYATKLGEWIGGTLVFLVLLFGFKYKYAVLFLIAILATSLTAQFFKLKVYPHEKRPAAYYEDLNQIKDVKKNKLYSFPSGHTSAAFTIFSFIAFAGKRAIWQFVAFVLAALVGISRVYLGQHFLNDVIAGASLGLILTAILYVLIKPKFDANTRLNKKMINR